MKIWLLCLAVCGLALGAPAAEPGADFGFPVGEELDYEAYWGIIPVGRATVSTAWIEEEGQRRLVIRYRARSNAVMDTLYPVDDSMECVIEPKSFLPLRFTKEANEGNYWTREITTFDHSISQAVWRSYTKNWESSDRQRVYPLAADTRELFSLMNYMRRIPLQPGSTNEFRLMADDKFYDLKAKYGPVEKIKVGRFGRQPGLRVVPDTKMSGLFLRSGGLTMWLSTEGRRLCTRMEARVPVASIWIVLQDVRGPGDDVWIQRSKELERQKK